jgi:hypothetical protein
MDDGSAQGDHPPPSLQAGELRAEQVVRLASSENEKPFSLHPLRVRRPLHPARQITNFLGLQRLIITAQATHS